jgi:peptidoglycan hydrolase-like protein with peptidoglycan-binding domain
MIKIHNVAALLAISSLAALPACSMFGGGNSSQASRSSYTVPQSAAVSPALVQQVQQRLQQQGLYNGQIDGVWGPGTEAAVRSYQQQHNLSASGQLDADTLASLNVGANQNYGAAQPVNPNYSNNNPPANGASANNATQPNGSVTR